MDNIIYFIFKFCMLNRNVHLAVFFLVLKLLTYASALVLIIFFND
jgi:hypothetical protein